jgi:asparagine synthase (glutamine-hydrolysing)
MCGIVGFVGKERVETLERSSFVLRHRGPDDSGLFLDGTVGLAMRRLSIIDVAGGQQPVTNEQGTLQVVFNGEIYNFARLRHDLEARGHRFTTSGDTEVIVHQYEEDRERCVFKLSGMFSFAVWDSNRRELFIARDRLGIKPLYYACENGTLYFASELKALTVFLPRLRVDNQAISDYLTYGYVPPPRTIFEGVHCLLPGHCLTYRDGTLRVWRYWDCTISDDPTKRSEKEWIAQLDEEIHRAVQSHLISDVPVGVFLSGGIDSSGVLALAQRHTARPLDTFTVGFDSGAKRYDESAAAAGIAQAIGARHHLQRVTGRDVADELDKITWHLDQPCSTAIPTYFISRLASQTVKVALTGLGGDELFAGYPRHRALRYFSPYLLLPDAMRRRMIAPLVAALPGSVEGVNIVRRAQQFVDSADLDPLHRYLYWSSVFKDGDRQAILADDFKEQLGGRHPVSAIAAVYADHAGLQYENRVLALDLKTYLPFDLLENTDKLSMAHSLEVRVPFCDHHLVELACSIPYSLKLRFGTGKYILRKVLAQYLPREVFKRPKQGFTFPMGLWLRDEFSSMVLDTFHSRSFAERGIINVSAIRRSFEDHAAGRADNTYKIWAVFMLESWFRRFIDDPSAVSLGRAS